MTGRSVVRISSDGLPGGTHVYVDELEIPNVMEIDWHIDGTSQSCVKLTLVGVCIDIDLPPVPADRIRTTSTDVTFERLKALADRSKALVDRSGSGTEDSSRIGDLAPPPIGKDPEPFTTAHTSTLAELFAPVKRLIPDDGE